MNEVLLREVISRVLASPEIRTILAAKPENPGQRPGGLIVVANEAGVLALPGLEKRNSSQYSLQLWLAGAASVPPGCHLPRVSCDQALAVAAWDRIFIPSCSASQLAQIALGLSLNQVSELVSRAICQGVPVEIGRVEYGYTERTPATYRKLLDGYARQAAAYGVIFTAICGAGDGGKAEVPVPMAAAKPTGCPKAPVEIPWSMAEPAGCQPPQATRESCSEICYEKRLLSEKEAMLLPPGAILQIAKATVLTPSAIDTLKKQKIEVYREGVQCL